MPLGIGYRDPMAPQFAPMAPPQIPQAPPGLAQLAQPGAPPQNRNLQILLGALAPLAAQLFGAAPEATAAIGQMGQAPARLSLAELARYQQSEARRKKALGGFLGEQAKQQGQLAQAARKERGATARARHKDVGTAVGKGVTAGLTGGPEALGQFVRGEDVTAEFGPAEPSVEVELRMEILARRKALLDEQIKKAKAAIKTGRQADFDKVARLMISQAGSWKQYVGMIEATINDMENRKQAYIEDMSIPGGDTPQVRSEIKKIEEQILDLTKSKRDVEQWFGLFMEHATDVSSKVFQGVEGQVPSQYDLQRKLSGKRLVVP